MTKGEKLTFNPETKTFEKSAPKRKQDNFPTFIRDEIVGGVESWVTGKIHDSKSTLRREYKEHGMIEKGNDRLPPRKPPNPEEEFLDAREDARKAYGDLMYDRIPVSEKERILCNEELRRTAAERKRRRTRWA
jgi:hypothetical protein